MGDTPETSPNTESLTENLTENLGKDKKNKKKYYYNQLERMEKYRICLDNTTQSDIAAALAKYGYDSAAIAEGQELYRSARTSYEHKQSSQNAMHNALRTAKARQQQLHAIFTEHRKLAKIAFRGQEQAITALGLKKTVPQNYVQLLNSCQVFYDALIADEQLQNAVARYQINQTEMDNIKVLMQQLGTARSEHAKAKGVAETATDQKNLSMKKLDNWMRDFEDIAQIALKNRPQLLESLGIYLPS